MGHRPAVLLVVVAAALAALSGPAAAAPTPQPYGTNDFGGFRDVLPPGTNGRANLSELAAFLANGTRPRHNDDQLDMYASLAAARPGRDERPDPVLLQGRDLRRAGRATSERTYSPRDDVTIVRDRPFGVPHVYGATRGRRRCSASATSPPRTASSSSTCCATSAARSSRRSSAARRATARWTRAVAPRPVHRGRPAAPGRPARRPLRRRRRALQTDAADYVAGVNEYIAEARLDPAKMPGEYAAIGRPHRRRDVEDDGHHRDRRARRRDLRQGRRRRADPGRAACTPSSRASVARRGERSGATSAPPRTPRRRRRSATGRRSPTRRRRPRPAGGSIAIARPRARCGGSTPVGDQHGRGRPRLRVARSPRPGRALAGLRLPQAQSNALLVSAARVEHGPPARGLRPADRLLRPADPHGAGRPRARPRRARRVLPGRQPLRPARPRPRLRLERDLRRPGHHRHLRRRALRARRRHADDRLDALPFPRRLHADRAAASGRTRGRRTRPTRRPPGTETLRADAHEARHRHRPRATIGGKARRLHAACARPTCTRSTRPAASRTSTTRRRCATRRPSSGRGDRSATRSTGSTPTTGDIAYFNSGNNPARADGVQHDWPVRACVRVEGLQPRQQHGDVHAVSQHPQVVDQDYLTSWNNKQAPGYRGADTNVFSLGVPLAAARRPHQGGHRGRAQDDAAPTWSTRWPTPPRSTCAPTRCCPRRSRSSAAATPTRPCATRSTSCARGPPSGAHRRDINGDGTYEHADAIRILDAWWPPWIKAQFEPALGAAAVRPAQLRASSSTTSPTTTARILAPPTRRAGTATPARTCARSSASRCRAPTRASSAAAATWRRCRTALVTSLKEALAVPASTLYADETCADAGQPADQDCFDKISLRPLGGITQPLINWQNRPTYQQVVEVQGHGPR